VIATCPTCTAETRDGICRSCAFVAALNGLVLSANAVEPPAPGTIEGYELLHELGAGATARVWLARERSLNRLVALKIIRPGADHHLHQRLIREGQAVARLRHPHIVTVHALTANGGVVTLAMDHLPGGDLKQRLLRGRPDIRTAAEWLLKLSDALAHAHANGVLHRDLKPSNVLLDEVGEPHLADFGLAAPLEGAGDLTAPGMVAGTAAYLAPEMLTGVARASPAADIYGLGAVLYECLTGRPPILGETAAAIFSQLPHLEPPSPRLLRPEVPPDLATICLKCLEKAPERRYASATALHEDLARFLRHEPILARPVGAAGRMGRWARRHPAAAAFAGLAALLLLTLAVGGPLVALRLAAARAVADAEAASSRAVSEFLRHDLLAQAAPDQQPDRDLRLRTVLDRAAERIEGKFPGQPLVEADLRQTLASTYFSLGLYQEARRQAEQVQQLRTGVLGPDDARTLSASMQVFDAWRAEGNLDEAERLGLEVVERHRRRLGPFDLRTAESLNTLAIVFRQRGKFAEAEGAYQEALEVQRAASGAEHPMTLTVMNNLSVNYRAQGKLSEAEALLELAIAGRSRALGLEHPDTLHSRNNLALVYKDQKRLPEAEAQAREVAAARDRVLGPEHPDTLISLASLATILQDQGRLEEAAPLSQRVLESRERQLGPDHPNTLGALNNLGTLFRDMGRLDEAEQVLRECLERQRRTLGHDHPSTLNTMGNLARVHDLQGRRDAALAVVTEALTVAEPARPAAPITQRLREYRQHLLAPVAP
jgi:eukaryotic-like serine/threonine-protein kinase